MSEQNNFFTLKNFLLQPIINVIKFISFQITLETLYFMNFSSKETVLR